MDQKTIVLRGTLCAIFGGICWGFSGTMGQFLSASKGVETSWIVTVRMIVAGIILLSVMALRQPKALTAVWRVRKDAVRLVVFLAVPGREAPVKK